MTCTSVLWFKEFVEVCHPHCAAIICHPNGQGAGRRAEGSLSLYSLLGTEMVTAGRFKCREVMAVMAVIL